MYYEIFGVVIKGEGYGRKLGFPTVNFETDDQKLPKAGVYAGEAMLEGTIYRAGIVIGPGKKAEAHLIGYDGNAYGKNVTLEIHAFLRGFQKFKTQKELIAQIEKDLKKC
jgi:riboflavin kinase/FMN adenylyltransferase